MSNAVDACVTTYRTYRNSTEGRLSDNKSEGKNYPQLSCVGMSAHAWKALPPTIDKAYGLHLYNPQLPLHNPTENWCKVLTTKPSLNTTPLVETHSAACLAAPLLVCQAYWKSLLTTEQTPFTCGSLDSSRPWSIQCYNEVVPERKDNTMARDK